MPSEVAELTAQIVVERQNKAALAEELTRVMGQRDRYKNGFLIEAARSESGKELMNDVVRIIRGIDGSCNDGKLVAQAFMDIGGAMAVYTQRCEKAPRVPAALELLDESTQATLELAGLKLLLEPLRMAVEIQSSLDRLDAVCERDPDDQNVVLDVPVSLLRALAAVLKVDTDTVKG